MSEELTYLYELYDPRDPETVWYVGVSKYPEERLKQHIRDPRQGNTRKYDWIHRLLADGVHPGVRVVRPVPISEWQDSEQNWIFWYRLENPDLTNISDGGAGHAGLSDETRRRMSEARRGDKNPTFGKPRSEETKRKCREANLGRSPSEETRRKIGEASKANLVGPWNPMFGKHHSEEAKRRMGELRRGKPKSEETRRRMSEAARNRSEEILRKMREARAFALRNKAIDRMVGLV